VWQEYQVYSDRLELQNWFLCHTVVVPASEILSVEIHPPGLIRGTKLDNCNLYRHFVILENPDYSNALVLYAIIWKNLLLPVNPFCFPILQ
jgi:hypothetical protein